MKINLAVLYFFYFIAGMLFIPVSKAFAENSEKLYKQKCGRCHIAFEADEYSPEEWPGVVKSMKAQAALSASELAEITAYLVRTSRSDTKQDTAFRPVVGGYLYTEYFETPQKKKNFDIHYLALYASGWANDKLYYFAEFELEHGGTGGDNTFVEQAYLEYWFVPNMALRIGAMLTPFNRFDEFHESYQQFHNIKTANVQRNRRQCMERRRNRYSGLSESE